MMARKRRKVVDLGGEAISKAEDYVDAVDLDSEPPKDYLSVPEDFLSIARLANIPAENTEKFLRHLNQVVWEFRFTSILDHDRRYYEDPIKKIKTACMGLVEALAELEDYEGGSAMLNCFFHRYLHSREELSGWQEVAQ